MKNETITIDKKLYEKLISNEKEYQLIFDNMLNGFALHEMIYDEDGLPIDYLFLSVNPSYSRITGIRNPMGQRVKEIFPELDKSWIDLFQNILTTGSPTKFQKYHVETERWYDIIGFKVREKEFAVFLTDITGLKEAEQEIEKALYFNITLLNAIPHTAMLISKDRIVLASNEKAKTMGAIINGNCFDGFSTCGQFCRDGGDCCFCERGLSLCNIDDKFMEIDAFGLIWDTWWVPVGDDAFLHYSIDITEMKRAEQNLKESARELEASNKELEQFAYIASHDLQEPLRVVSTYCQLIAMFVEENCSDTMTEEEGKELAQYIYFTKDATNRMRFLIKDLLEFSRVGRADIVYEVIDVNDVIEAAIRDFDVAIKEHEVVIEYTDMPIIMGRRRRIGQIFHNLISNAIKFRSDKNVIISIDVEERENDWLFSVSDTGIGIDEKHQERIFGIFKRLHARDDYPGTGIGLSLVKKIVENHGGNIWVDSSPEGSTFFFTIAKTVED